MPKPDWNKWPFLTMTQRMKLLADWETSPYTRGKKRPSLHASSLPTWFGDFLRQQQKKK